VGSDFVATGLVGSLTVPLVFEFVLDVFVVLAIIRNKQFDAPVRSNEANRTGALSNGYAAAGRNPTTIRISGEIGEVEPKGASLSTSEDVVFCSGWQI
jgi:hypothetical protein